MRLACAGAVVLDDLSSPPDLAHAPWTDERLVGVIDFPHLEIRADAGVPRPEEVNEPVQQWRSRLVDDRWQISTHRPRALGGLVRAGARRGMRNPNPSDSFHFQPGGGLS